MNGESCVMFAAEWWVIVRQSSYLSWLLPEVIVVNWYRVLVGVRSDLVVFFPVDCVCRICLCLSLVYL